MTTKNKSTFADYLRDPDDFTLTFELVPSRGGRSKEHARTIALAKEIALDGRIRAVSITENAGGHSALSPEVLGIEIKAMGLEVIIHFSCKDKNRNQMESLLFGWDREEMRNLLVITGDYPQAGYKGFPKPVFDLGSVHALDLISRLNKGLFSERNQKPKNCHIKPTSFFNGVAVSPFKRLRSELIPQYYKLHRKAAAGADYVITQVGFDARKFQEILLYMKQNNLNLPLIGNVFIPNLAVTEIMYKGGIPGCIITEKLYEQIIGESKSPDKGRKARLVRAAKLLCVLRGLGYNGAHIGGPGLTFADIDFVLNEAEAYYPDWKSLVSEMSYWYEAGCYYFQKDHQTGLNSDQLAVEHKEKAPCSIAYTLAKLFHDLMFEKKGLLYMPMKSTCETLGMGRMAPAWVRFEHLLKFLAFECRNCGDCALHDLGYLCPQSGCAKYLLNGPCGGSRDGWCEVFPGVKRCFYVRLYERLLGCGREQTMKDGFVPPRNWSLNATSSWLNYYQGRDHAASEQG
ncbi:MAG: methylenetetrahydrofolate reductase C-terminal domain-containing protein [Proteobacteria bacterium]|nr:methylenetetrahydrofolate reductase C-terminal domain-containing protein [Pseudomonadota bacterium]MBU1711413.1 methylenetetrahydrofolate reductase C-terminal domain-containing protein [Pseudomonadota bacterium]